MACPPIWNTCIYEGDTPDFSITIKGQDDISYNLTTAKAIMYIKRYKSDYSYISIKGLIADPSTGMVFFRFTEIQTLSMTSPDYLYEIRLTWPNPNYKVWTVLQGTISTEEPVRISI